jgi:hypothetical protein
MEHWQAIVVGLFAAWAVAFFVLRAMRFFVRLGGLSTPQGQQSCCAPGDVQDKPRLEKETQRAQQAPDTCDLSAACAHCPLHKTCDLKAQTPKSSP